MTIDIDDEQLHQPNRGDIESNDSAYTAEDESPHQGEPGYYEEEEQTETETNVQIIERKNQQP